MIYAISVEYDDDEMSPVTIIVRAGSNKEALDVAIEAALSARTPTRTDEVKGVTILAAFGDDALEGTGSKIVF